MSHTRDVFCTHLCVGVLISLTKGVCEMRRRDFFRSLAGGVLAIGTLVHCEWDPSGGETLLDLLVRHGRNPEGRFRVVDGKMRFYIDSVDGKMEDVLNDRYWIFFVDGIPINAPVDEVIVSSGARVSMRLMRPPEV